MPDAAIRDQQVRTLYVQAIPILIANPLNAVVVYWVLYGKEPREELLGWFTAMLFVTGLRWWLRRAYFSTPPEERDSNTWGRRFALGSGVAGGLWGLGGWLFYVPGQSVNELVMTFVLAGSTAGAAGTQSCYMPAFLSYFIPALLPFAARVASPGDALHLGMAAMVVLYGVVLVAVARNTYTAIRESFRLGLENRALVERLQAAQSALSQDLHAARQMEAVGRLAAGVAHDFNNMLTIVMGNARDLHEGSLGAADTRLALEDVLSASKRGSDLVKELLAFGQKQRLELTTFDLNTLVREDERLLKRLLGEHIDLQLELDEEPLFVHADAVQIRQVLINLLTNGRDAMPDGGPLVVKTTRWDGAGRSELPDEPYISLSVRDSGSGMDEETLRRVFEPFFTTKASGAGTGLGLATVHGVAHQSGGKVEVSSALGKGSEFRLLLPEAKSAPELADEPDALSLRPPPGKRATILVAEDDPLVRAVMGRTLRAMGHQVLLAEDGRRALELAAEHANAISLLVTDVLMPGINGPALFEKLRGNVPGLRALFVSGYTADQAIPEGYDARVSYLPKPFGAESLRQKVESLLGYR